MIKLPGVQLTDPHKGEVIKEIESFIFSQRDLNGNRTRINNWIEIDEDIYSSDLIVDCEYYLFHDAWVVKGKSQIDKREVTKLSKKELLEFMEFIIDPGFDGIDMMAIPIDSKLKYVIVADHDGDIYLVKD